MSEQLDYIKNDKPEITNIDTLITEVENIEDSEEENKNESEEDELEDEESNTIKSDLNSTLKDNSELYIVTHNGIPKFYTKSVDDARKQMWDLARTLRFQEFNFNTYIRERNNSSIIEVVGCNKFSFVNIDRVIHWLRIHCIKQIEYNSISEDDKNADTTTTQKEQTSSSLWNIFS